MTASNDLLVFRETKTLPNYKDLLSQLLDATALFGHVCQELSLKRKETIKPILHSDFKSVCSCTHKVGKLLFGEDLSKVVQDLRASTKVRLHNSPPLSLPETNLVKTNHLMGVCLKTTANLFYLRRGGTNTLPERHINRTTRHLHRNRQRSNTGKRLSKIR